MILDELGWRFNRRQTIMDTLFNGKKAHIAQIAADKVSKRFCCPNSFPLEMFGKDCRYRCIVVFANTLVLWIQNIATCILPCEPSRRRNILVACPCRRLCGSTSGNKGAGSGSWCKCCCCCCRGAGADCCCHNQKYCFGYQSHFHFCITILRPKLYIWGQYCSRLKSSRNIEKIAERESAEGERLSYCTVCRRESGSTITFAIAIM